MCAVIVKKTKKEGKLTADASNIDAFWCIVVKKTAGVNNAL